MRGFDSPPRLQYSPFAVIHLADPVVRCASGPHRLLTLAALASQILHEFVPYLLDGFIGITLPADFDGIDALETCLL